MKQLIKSSIINLIVLLVAPALSCCQDTCHFERAGQLLREKDYFGARDYYQKHNGNFSPAEDLVLKAHIAAAFNRPASSNKAIALFQKQPNIGVDDAVKLAMLRLQQQNYSRLFEYGNALKAHQEVLSKYKHVLSKTDSVDDSNTALICKALTGKPKQRIVLSGNTVIKMKRDAANLPNISVKSKAASVDFIFDTGANFSTVSYSTAGALKMEILEGVIEVGTVTGAKVKSKVALCPSFMMGNIKVENAVFLVMPDSALAFPQIKYQINGIIGFPVIEALKEVQLTRADEFIVPQTKTRAAAQNMALDFLTPIYQLGDEYFTFDTGADATMLYSKYLEKHRQQITGQYPLIDLTFGGAGGASTRKGYKIMYHPVVGGKALDLKDIEVFDDKFNGERDHFYGNLGQDIIKQFDKMIINFSDMFIQFR